MPHVYRSVSELQGKPKKDNGECVRLVQALTKVGHTSTWRAGMRVLDATFIEAGTVVATFNRQGRWPGKSTGNHAAFFVRFGPRAVNGKPMYIVVMDQWTSPRKATISMRTIHSRGPKLHDEGNAFDDSDNADHFYIVQ